MGFKSHTDITFLKTSQRLDLLALFVKSLSHSFHNYFLRVVFPRCDKIQTVRPVIFTALAKIAVSDLAPIIFTRPEITVSNQRTAEHEIAWAEQED